jgi:hypothetical protein
MPPSWLSAVQLDQYRQGWRAGTEWASDDGAAQSQAWEAYMLGRSPAEYDYDDHWDGVIANYAAAATGADGSPLVSDEEYANAVAFRVRRQQLIDRVAAYETQAAAVQTMPVGASRAQAGTEHQAAGAQLHAGVFARPLGEVRDQLLARLRAADRVRDQLNEPTID